MPGGVPVATFAIGEAGAKNAALHAAAILGLSDVGVKKRLDRLARQADQVGCRQKAEMKTLDQPVPPGGTIGIIGGGQLGRMLALAAARLGLQTCIYNDAPDAPAFQVTEQAHCDAPYDDLDMLASFRARSATR